MAMGRPKAVLVLSPQQREQLEGLANSRSLPAGLVSRARIILLSASGKTNQQIARQLGLTNATVGKWRRRFLEQDVSGLHDELRPGRPRPISMQDAGARNLRMHPLESRQIVLPDAAIEVDGAPCIWQAFGLDHRTGSGNIFNQSASNDSCFRRESTGYCRVVLASAGKRGGFVRG